VLKSVMGLPAPPALTTSSGGIVANDHIIRRGEKPFAGCILHRNGDILLPIEPARPRQISETSFCDATAARACREGRIAEMVNEIGAIASFAGHRQYVNIARCFLYWHQAAGHARIVVERFQ
jgi:hypothetical protein